MILFVFSLLYFLSPTPVSSLNREAVYLQRVKLSLSDPYSSLFSWNDEDDTSCNWLGVTCDSVTHSVNSVDPTHANVGGPFPSLLCRISDSLSQLGRPEIPDSLSRIKRLIHLDLAINYLVGTIPSSLTELTSVVEIVISNNSLRLFDISMNWLSGEIPEGLCWFHPENLNLDDYEFEGQIPETLASSPNLCELRLSHNRFMGELPENLGGNSPLRWIDLSNNALDLQGNGLSDELPLDNDFSGRIPDEFGTLPVLSYLDFPRNWFSGEITNGLQNLKFPPIFANEMYRKCFMGNPSLGAGTKVFCACRNEETEQGYAWLLLLPLILVLAVVSVFAAGLAWFYLKYRNFKKPLAIDESKWTLMSFHKLGFSEYEILDCLDEGNMIGSGASGKVYKVVLTNGEAVAVKNLWEGAKKNFNNVFETEIEFLGKIRHKNIAKLQCCCATSDCKLLAYEYLPNGSLGDKLHRNKGGVLDWPTRYKIIVGAAEGLSYLHNDCVPPIIHGNFKSNNILLDGDFEARVSHFGFAKLVEDSGEETNSMSSFAHSYGYNAPEYGNNFKANQKSDIYCFGVVMLELVTGKLPINSDFRANNLVTWVRTMREFRAKDLVTWIRTMRDQKCLDKVLDPKLDLCFKEEIIKVLKIGLLCTDVLPINRPSMRILVKALKQ